MAEGAGIIVLETEEHAKVGVTSSQWQRQQQQQQLR